MTEWKRFLATLETHEAGHKDISAKAGREIVERLRDMSGVCSQISVRADEIARVIVERANGEQKAYDATRSTAPRTLSAIRSPFADELVWCQ